MSLSQIETAVPKPAREEAMAKKTKRGVPSYARLKKAYIALHMKYAALLQRQNAFAFKQR